MLRSAILAAALLLPLPVRAGCLIALDIGHYAEAPGEISARGVPELVYNTALAGRVKAALDRAGIAAVVINADGDIAELAQRPRRAQAAGASLLVSLHHDSVQDGYKSTWEWKGTSRAYSDVFSGFGLFVSGRNPALAESLTVAEDLGDGLRAAGLVPSLHHAEATLGENRPLLDAGRGIYRFDDLAVLRQAAMPAVLVEAGIIVNRADEEVIASEPYRAVFAAAIAQAAAGHCRRLESKAAIP